VTQFPPSRDTFARYVPADAMSLPTYIRVLLYALVAAAVVLGRGAWAAQPVLRDVVEERVDVIHRELFYDGEGRLVFVQIIFMEDVLWPTGRLSPEVVAWRLEKDHSPAVQRDIRGGFYVLWNDGGTTRRVSARSYVESHSQTDSELAAREWLPPDQRRGLKGEKPLPGRPPFVIETPADQP
jgi:hypothetical protein